MLNASTGARVALPAGTNTAADETHPSITIDGRRLVFERSDPAAGTVRIIVVDLTTSQSADLFNGFEVGAARAQRAGHPAFGSSVVYTGGPFVAVSGAWVLAAVISTDLSNFPAGPFPRSTFEQQYDFLANGSLQDLAAGGALIAFQETRTGFNGELVLRQLGGTASIPLANGQTTFANPNMAASNPEIVVFDQRSVSGAGAVGAGDIVFRPATTCDLRRPPDRRCRRSSTRRRTSRSPRSPPTSRYLAFVRHGRRRARSAVRVGQPDPDAAQRGGVDLGAIDLPTTWAAVASSPSSILSRRASAPAA